jgi:MFS family permease
VFTLFTAGCALAPTVEGLVVLRFLAGAFGSSPLTIAGGILADIWPNEQRGLAMIFFSSAPLFGPALGPVIGGFLGEDAGWRWVQGFL